MRRGALLAGAAAAALAGCGSGDVFRQIENALIRAARAARKGDRPGIADLARELDTLGGQVDALGFKCE